ncbi:MAG: hypothetical protein U0670_16620 [Anaerolineae bacterium]
MISVLLKLMVSFCGLFALLIGAICAQPYVPPADARALTAFLSDCDSPPCLLGISIGTPAGEAMARLRAHPWVELVWQESMTDGRHAWISWRWSAAAPGWLERRARDGMLDVALFQAEFPITGIHTRIRLSYGDLWLALPHPIAVFKDEFNGYFPSLTSYLIAPGVTLLPDFSCSTGYASLWDINGMGIELPDRDATTPTLLWAVQPTINTMPYLCRRLFNRYAGN